jgi:hypothetical protein
MEADLLDARLAVGFKFLCPYGTHFCFEVLERVADDSFAACDGNIAARCDSEDTAAHGTEARSSISGPPAQDGGDQHGQQVCMTGQYPEAAALILGVR